MNPLATPIHRTRPQPLRRHVAAWLLAALVPAWFGVSSCASDLAPPLLDQGCTLNSDCNSPLVCAYHLCHQECASDRDCPSGERCITADRPFDVCQLPSERNCTANSQCPAGLICAVDDQCRDWCNSNRDCITGQVCTQGACADPSETGDGGGLPNVQDSGVGVPCVLNSDCGDAGLVCRQGLCSVQCDVNVDCVIPEGPGGVCIDHICQTPRGACSLNSDCGDAGLVCRRAVCTVQCNLDIDCEVPEGPGGPCVANICQTGITYSSSDAGRGGSDGGADAGDAGDGGDAGMQTGSSSSSSSTSSSSGASSSSTSSSSSSSSYGSSSGSSSGGSSGSTDDAGTYPVMTLTGNGTASLDGPAATALFDQPNGIAVDTKGNVYVSDYGDGRIRKMDSKGNVTTLAGNGTIGWVDGTGGPAGTAEFGGGGALDNSGFGVAIDAQGNVYVADTDNNCVRKIDAAGNVTTLAGNGKWGFANGTGGRGGTAMFASPAGVAVDGDGNVYVADSGNSCVRKIDPSGAVTTLAGTGSPGEVDGTGGPTGTAEFTSPSAVAVDANGIVYVTDTPQSGGTIRRIDTSGNVTTVGTGGASFGSLTGIAVDTHGNLFVAGNGAVSTISTSSVVTGLPGAPRESAMGVAVDGHGNVFVTDNANCQVLEIASGTLTTFSGAGVPFFDGTGGPRGTAEFGSLQGIAVDTQGNVYVADSGESRLRKIDSAGNVTTLAGNGTAGYMDGTGGPTGKAEFDNPIGVAVDGQGNVYVGDAYNNCVRKIDPAGNVTTLAGNGTLGFVDGTGGPTGTAELNYPQGVAVDAQGNVYVADSGNASVRKIDSAGNVTTLAGNGTAGFVDGTGGPTGTAEFNWPQGVAVDAQGNVYVGDDANSRVRKIDSLGNVTTLAGNGIQGCVDGTGGPTGTAELDFPNGVAVDAQGNVYLGDVFNSRIRKIDPAGNVTTLAGNGTAGYMDGTGGPNGTAEFAYPQGVAVDSQGNVYVADTGNKRIRVVHARSRSLLTCTHDSDCSDAGPCDTCPTGAVSMCLAPLGPLSAGACKKPLAPCTPPTSPPVAICGPLVSSPVGGNPWAPAFDGTNMWVANFGSNTVTTLSPTGVPLGTFGVGSAPERIAFDGTNMWVANWGDGTVTELLPDGGTLGTFPVGNGPEGIAFDGKNMWVTNSEDDTVTELLPDGGTLGTFPVGTFPVVVAFDGTNMWVTNQNSDDVTEVLPDGGTLGPFPVGNQPFGIAFDGTNMWVANQGTGDVTKLGPDGGRLGTFPVGSGPVGIAFDGTNMWVTNGTSNTVTKLSLTGAPLGTFPVGGHPFQIAFDGMHMWVANFGNGTVTEL